MVMRMLEEENTPILKLEREYRTKKMCDMLQMWEEGTLRESMLLKEEHRLLSLSKVLGENICFSKSEI